MAKYYYNDVLLPEIPADVLAKYPYCVMYRKSASLQFLLAGPNKWWANTSTKKLFMNTTTTYVRYELTDDESEWTYDNSWTDNGSMQFESIIWSNHDIPNGSADATEIYFYGSEPIPESGNDPSEPETDTLYIVNGSDLTAVADSIRGKAGTTDELAFPDGFVSAVEGISSGGGELVLPENARLYYVGNVISTLDFSGLSLESNAVGVLREE